MNYKLSILCISMLKKIILFGFIFICFMLTEFRDNLINNLRFYMQYEERAATEQQKQAFIQVDAFFERLANQLFFEKHDSALVKELFLASKPPYTDLIGCLYLGYYGKYNAVRRALVLENVLTLHLNLYRLCFEMCSGIRLVFWDFRKQLNIKSEQDYKTALSNAIHDYCCKFKIDAHDKQAFDELINYQFSATALKITKWH